MKKNCVLTGQQVESKYNGDTTSYVLTFGGVDVSVIICESCSRLGFPINPKTHIVQGLIANGKWPSRVFIVGKDCSHRNRVVNAEIIEAPEYLNSAYYPNTPLEKMNNLFLSIYAKQKYDGDSIVVSYEEDFFWMKNYFLNKEECHFYMKGLEEKNWIEIDKGSGLGKSGSLFRITHLGLNKVIDLLDTGILPNTCFVAMSFSEEMKTTREAIRLAITRSKHVPIIIDEAHLASDKTIPDAIFSHIKRSKFCIADFTEHRNGVYFESGFALGLGKPVIYLCKEADFKTAHFDIRQLQHIIYSNEAELEQRLFDKIEAWLT